MNSKLTGLLTSAIVTGLMAAQIAKAEEPTAKTGDAAAVEKNGCKGEKSGEKNSCKGMKDSKKKKKEKNSCKNSCGEKNEKQEEGK